MSRHEDKVSVREFVEVREGLKALTAQVARLDESLSTQVESIDSRISDWMEQCSRERLADKSNRTKLWVALITGITGAITSVATVAVKLLW